MNIIWNSLSLTLTRPPNAEQQSQLFFTSTYFTKFSISIPFLILSEKIKAITQTFHKLPLSLHTFLCPIIHLLPKWPTLLWLRFTLPCALVDIHLKECSKPFFLPLSLVYLFPLCFQGYSNRHMTCFISLLLLSQTGSHSVAKAAFKLTI